MSYPRRSSRSRGGRDGYNSQRSGYTGLGLKIISPDKFPSKKRGGKNDTYKKLRNEFKKKKISTSASQNSEIVKFAATSGPLEFSNQ